MFSSCGILEDLDLAYFKTKNAKFFNFMFNKCYKLKKIDVSKFDTSKCENIRAMFQNCHSIEEIDMINWDMSNLKNENEEKKNPIDYLFYDCKKLKKIKIGGNIKKEEVEAGDFKGMIFYNIPINGKLIMNKNIECNISLDEYFPSNWIKIKE